MEYVSTKSAPAAIGPYSQAIKAGDFLYASGQIPINPESGEIEDITIADQADRVCRNIGEILSAAGTDYEHVVKTTCFLAEMADFAAFNAVYAKYFVGKPARSCVEVSALPKGALLEIDAVAFTYKG